MQLPVQNPECVLVLAAHPDDEVLGCGGVVALHIERGDVVYIVFVADGVSARDFKREDTESAVESRRNAARAAAYAMGAHEPFFLDFPDQRLDQQALIDIVQAIEQIAHELRPSIVYTHHDGDLNIDHRIVVGAALTAFRPFPGQTVRAIYGFEVLSSTEWRFGTSSDVFRPARFVDVSLTWSRKIEALRAYACEMRSFPHPRSYETVEALARLRGSSVGLELAEAFVTYREIIL